MISRFHHLHAPQTVHPGQAGWTVPRNPLHEVADLTAIRTSGADLDGDGIKDSNLGTYAAQSVIYNYAKPRVHLEGMNVTMIDGHVERMSFQDFLNPDHPSWTDIP